MVKIPDSQTISDLWGKVVARSIPVKSLSKAEYDVLDDAQKNADVLYVVFNSAGIVLMYKGIDFSSGDSAYLLNAPIGAIIIWSGTEDTIPEGWHICDGQNGTFDLRDQFLLAAGEKHEVGETGGSEEVKLTVEQMPQHEHSQKTKGTLYALNSSSSGTTAFTGVSGAGSIVVDLVSSAGRSAPHPNMPPYRTVLYIQKIGPTPSDYVTEERVEEIVQEAVENIPTDRVTMDQVNQAIDAVMSDIQTEEVYSAEETRIGTWIDGKPLYKITIALTTPASLNTDSKVYNLASLNIDTLIDISGMVSPSNNTSSPVNYFGHDSYYIATWYNRGGSTLGVRVGNSIFVSRPAYVTLKYTKTTD